MSFKHNKKYTLFIVTLIMILFVISGIYFSSSKNVYADTGNISLEEYTDSDELMGSNEKNIVDFANEVNSMEEDDVVADLTKVIPVEYVRFVEEGYTFQYNGKEYGFFVCHRRLVGGDIGGTKLIDVVLIDFTYSYVDIKCSLSIKLLMQVTLQYHNDNGIETWTIHHENAKKDYYIVNPRFVSILQNENDLNYGDNGYVKRNDYGTIIQQATLNYNGAIIVNDGVTSEEGIAMFHSALSGLADFAIGLIPIPQVGTVYSAIANICDFVETLRDSIDYEIASLSQGADGEILYKSRGVQENEPETIPFSRVMATAPQNEILLTDDPSSYMRCNTILDNSISRSRIIQCVQFDILQTSKAEPLKNRKFMNALDDDEKRIPFAAYQEKILFEDQNPKFEVVENNIEGVNIPVYILPNGKQTIAFKPDYSAYYKFDFEDSTGLNLSVIDSNGNAVKDNGYYDLKDGENYSIIVTSGDEKAITSLGISLVDGKSSGTVYAKEQRLVKLNISQSDVYNLSTNNSYCLIDDILVKTSRGFIKYSEYSGYTPNSTVSVPLQKGEYYVLVYNSSAVNRSFNLGAEECAVGEVGETNAVNTDGMNYVYIKFEIDAGDYIGTILNAENYKVLDCSLESIPISRLSDGNFFVENNGDVLYIGVLAGEGTTNVLLNLSENSTMWKINGEVVDNNKAELERGNSYEIEFYINGIEQGDTFIFNFNGAPDGLAEAINFTGNILTIKDYCLTDYSFTVKYYFNALAESISGLEITPVYTVTFEGIDITNDEELTFNWVQTDDLATIYYEVSNGTISCDGSVDTTGYVVGNTYSEDLTQYLSSFGISNVTITISKIDVTTSKGAMAVNLKTPFTAKVHMAYGSGSGTKNNPYIISCNRHFENMGINTDADTYFTITKYLKLEGNVIEDFYGIIESKDLVVISWTPEDKQKMGIIINNSGTIRNLQVNVNYNFNLTGLWGHTVGGIVCNNEDSGLIENCSVTMIRASKLNHTTTVGGIAGINNGTINNCYATVDVITGGTFGGIAGINYGTITDSCGMGDIVQKVETYEGCYELSYVGGIAGVNGAGGEISNCVGGTRDDSYLYVIIDVANVDDANLAPYSGPIAGENKGTVKDCSNYGYAIRTGNLHTGSNYNQLRNINNII